jgi:hypothetical protein
MAALSAAKRWARLCWWLGLGAATMIIAACATLFSGGCNSTPLKSKDAGTGTPIGSDAQPGPDLPVKPDLAAGSFPIPPNPSARDAESIDAAESEANPTLDSGKSDLWEIICE